MPARVAHRCKRKASTKQLAHCIRGHASVRFPAKVPALPAGPYQHTCSGCQVLAVHGALQLRCKHCAGAKPTQVCRASFARANPPGPSNSSARMHGLARMPDAAHAVVSR